MDNVTNKKIAIVGGGPGGLTLATLLQANGVSVKATQDMLRHASSRLTMDLYAQSIPADRRAAQSGIIGALLAASVPKCSHDNL